MADPIVWKNVKVNLQSVLGDAKTVASITKANPGVATSADHGFTDGQIVFIEAKGVYQLTDRPIRVANSTANTFELEGVNTTSFETFTSCTAKLVTLGTAVTTAVSISSQGGNIPFIDTTTIHENTRSQIPGLPDASSFSWDHIWDATDPGLLAMKAASDIQQKMVIKFQFGTGGKIMLFAGYVACSLMPAGQAQGLVTTPAAVTMNGVPTYYAS
jgi:hypothetical protein